MKLSKIVYDHGGIHLGDNKKELVHARLNKVLRRRGIKGFDDYIRILQDDKNGEELVGLLDAISTNVTHFFREHKHFDFIADNLAPNVGSDGLKFWSAGCSSGEEPYSLAITLLERFPVPMRQRYSILATDISTKVLQRAVTGLYPMKSVQNLEKQLVRKYFLRGKNDYEGMVKVKKEVAKMVTFQRLNLIEQFTFNEGFDAIFCRNVMIYFDTETRQRLIDRYYDALKPGGYLIIGHSESMNSFKHRFHYIQPTIYRKEH
jgi:chemotaxis protein methyltransferase CheR